MSLRQWEKILFINLACVASVSARVIARKLGARPSSSRKKNEGRGRGRGRNSFLLSPPPSFIYFYFCSRSSFHALTPAKSLGTQVIINWVDTVDWPPFVSRACEYSRPPWSSPQSLSARREGCICRLGHHREVEKLSFRAQVLHSLPPPPPSPPHQLNTSVALVNNAVQNVSVIKILTCNHPSENWVVTFLINCLYVSCPHVR